MKIAIMSDHHLGFKGCKYRFRESFENLNHCFQIAAAEKADAILMPGDIFDEAIPPLEVWHQGFEVFREAQKGNSPITVSLTQPEGELEKATYSGIPIIAIHGTHEFRSRGYKNAVQVLAEAGMVIYVHANVAVLEKGTEKIAVHGLGGVPEKHALDALRLWNPKPMPGMKNVVLLHQSIKEYLPFDDPMIATIGMEDLPAGFDFIFNGHLHWHSDTPSQRARLVIPGSTIFTQSKKLEAEKSKGFYLWDTGDGSLTFKDLPRQRKLYYHKIKFQDASAEQVSAKVKELVEEDMSHSHEKEPIIRIKMVGTLQKGVSSSSVAYEEVLKKYEGKAIFSIDKHFVTPAFRKTIDELRELQKSRKSIASLGISLLEKNLSQTAFENAFDVRQVFDLLAENKIEDAMDILSEVQAEYSAIPKKEKSERKITLPDFSK